RNFANKIWNASRFALMNLAGFDPDRFVDLLQENQGEGNQNQGKASLALVDRWILARLQRTIGEVNDSLESFRINDAAQAIYRFIWSELCDWYIELVKSDLYADGGQGTEPESAAQRRRLAQGTLAHVLEAALRLLHPFMPFVTEEIWQQLPKPTGAAGSIMVTLYPSPDRGLVDDEAEAQMNLVMDVAVAIRGIRAEYRVPPAEKVRAIVSISDDARRCALAESAALVERAARASLEIVASSAGCARLAAKMIVGGDVEVLVPLEGIVDVAAERARLVKDAGKVEKDIQISSRKLENPAFVERAPADVVENERARLEELRARLVKLEEARRALQTEA
ncbi:MAG: class I tRNA ligase family protein, partial [Pseudomonadota bacterium]